MPPKSNYLPVPVVALLSHRKPVGSIANEGSNSFDALAKLQVVGYSISTEA